MIEQGNEWHYDPVTDTYKCGEHPALNGWQCPICNHDKFEQLLSTGRTRYYCARCTVLFMDPHKFRVSEDTKGCLTPPNSRF